MRRLLLASLVVAGLTPGPMVPRASGQARPLREERARAPVPTATQVEARDAGERARAAAAEEEQLATQRVTAASALQHIETEVAERAAEVSTLAERRAGASARLAAHAAALSPLLPLMERLALFPAETLLAVPAPPEQALRGLGVLRGMARRLEQEAAGLRREQAALAAESAALDAALPALRQAQARQAEQARALDADIASAQGRRLRAEEAGVEAQRRAAAEAARSESLRGALAVLEAARARAEAQLRESNLRESNLREAAGRGERQRQEAAAAEARRVQASLSRPAGTGVDAGPGPQAPPNAGTLLQPVAGSVVRAWGERTDAGPATGVSYRPAPQARVVAPCAGRVRFSGPFRSFGALVILDCGGGYAFVLAGLERLDVTVGAAVLAGEPVGTMPGWDATSAAARPALYMELRHDGVAVNPAPFLRGKG